MKELWQKLRALKLEYKVAISIVVIIFLWLLMGIPGCSKKAPSHDLNLKNDIGFRYEVYEAQDKQTKVPLTGISEAAKIIELKAEVSGKVEKISATDGEYLEGGSIILEIDREEKVQQLKYAKALLKQREQEYKSTNELGDKGFKAKNSIDTAVTSLESARTEVTRAELNLENCIVKAPFTGYLDKLQVEEGDMISAGSTNIGNFISFFPLIIISYLPEKLVGKISIGNEAELILAGGGKLMGKLTFVSKIADPNTRAFKIKVEADKPEDLEGFSKMLYHGMTVDVRLSRNSARAHKIPASALVLEDNGEIGVKILVDDKIEFKPVTVISDENDGVWVEGLPNVVKVITVGHNFVKSGSTINKEVK